jgi:hypothetical protein
MDRFYSLNKLGEVDMSVIVLGTFGPDTCFSNLFSLRGK